MKIKHDKKLNYRLHRGYGVLFIELQELIKYKHPFKQICLYTKCNEITSLFIQTMYNSNNMKFKNITLKQLCNILY